MVGKKSNFSFAYLNITQFLVTLNDSIFRLIVAYSLIDVLGAKSSNNILSISAAVFVLPFLLFSMPSGQLADKFSKRRVIMWTLWAELIFMFIGIVAIEIRAVFWSYFALFLIAMQSSVFSPSKYSILPELVPAERLAYANGMITLATYLSIITGTFLASFISDITNRNYTFVVLLCVIFSIIAIFTGARIEKTEPKKPDRKINPFFITDIFKTLAFAGKYEFLVFTIFSAAYFLFTAAYTQLNLIPFGMQSLGITDVQTGYVYLAAALGIGVGSILVGILSGKTVELGLSIWGAFGTAISYMLLYVFQYDLVSSCIIFFSIGMHGGLYVVPLDAYIQYVSPEKDRGSIVAASTFLSFFSILISALFLFTFGTVLELMASTGFLIIGFLSLVVAMIMLARLPTFIPRLISVVIARFFLTVTADKTPEKCLLVCENKSWSTIFSLIFNFQRIKFVKIYDRWPDTTTRLTNYITNRLTICLDKHLDEPSISKLRLAYDKNYTICLFLEDIDSNENILDEIKNNIKPEITYTTITTDYNYHSKSFFHFFNILHPVVDIKFRSR